MAWATVKLQGYHEPTAVNTNWVVAILETAEGCRLQLAAGPDLQATESASEVGKKFFDAEASQFIPVKIVGA